MDNNQQPQVTTQTDPVSPTLSTPVVPIAQPNPTVFGGGSAPTPPKKSRKILVLVIIIVLLAVGAGVAFFMLKDTSEAPQVDQNQASSDDSVVQQPADTSANTLEEIKRAAIKLGPDVTEPSQDSYMDNFYSDVPDNIDVVIDPAEVYLRWRSASKESMSESLATILTSNGLSVVAEDVYGSDKVACKIDGSMVWTSLQCVKQSTLQEAKDHVSNVVAAVKNQDSGELFEDRSSVTFVKSTDGTVEGAVYWGAGLIRDSYTYFFVFSEGTWVYVSKADIGQNSNNEDLYNCTVLKSGEYKDVFVNYTSTPYNCKK